MWPYKRGASGLTRGGQFTISVNQKSGLIIGVAFGECGLIIGVAFVECGLIIGVAFGECGLIREELLCSSDIIPTIATLSTQLIYIYTNVLTQYNIKLPQV